MEAAEKVAYLATHYKHLAEKDMNNNSPGKSFFHLSLCLRLMPQWKNELRSSFSSALCSYGKILEHEEKFNELFTSYEQALEIFPNDEVILNNLGAHLYRLQHLKEALVYFEKALKLNQYYLPAYRNMEITKSRLVERWHFRMLNDQLRNKSYQKSIYKKIKSNLKTVLDIGTGTGLLSIYAKEAGATSIHSCDYSPVMIEIAEKVLNDNFLSDSIVLIDKLSTEIRIPEDIPQRLSMAVTETFDAGLLGEHILQTLIHAWEHLLESSTNEEGRPIQRVIPENAVIYMTPIESLQLARKYYALKSNRTERESYSEGLDFSKINLSTLPAEPYDTENLKNISFKPIGPTVKIFEFDFNNVSELKQFYCGGKDNVFNVELNCKGFFDALAIWFELILDSETLITSSPFSKNSCCWEQAIFPIKTEYFINKCTSVLVSASCKEGILSLKVNPSEDNESNTEYATEPIIRLLNCESQLLTYIQMFNYIKTVFAHKGNISVLDLSWYPYVGLMIFQQLNCVVHTSSQHLEIYSSINGLFSCNDTDKSKLRFIKWPEMLELLGHRKDNYDIILIDILTTTGEINEEVISLIPLLKDLLDVNGLFFPYKLIVYCQLIFSEELVNLSQMNFEGDEFQIAKFINKFKVSHMVDFALKELNYEEMSPVFEIASLDMDQIVNKTLKFKKEIEILKPGTVNAIAYWFSIKYSPDVMFSSLSADSHINQAAALLDYPLNIRTELKLNVNLYYNSGAMRFIVR